MMPSKFGEFNIAEYQWTPEIRKQVSAFEPELCSIIDNLDLDDSHTILKLTYPFGARIFGKGIFYLPTVNNETVAINDNHVPAYLKQQLSYSSLPLGIILDHGTEVFSEHGDRVFSLVYFRHGLNLGIWEAFAPASPFSLSAGARSLFMLPKITNAEKHKNLRQYGVNSPAPLTPFEQHATFVKIANHKNFPEPWVCEILFLTAPWMQKIKNDKNKWRDLHVFLLNRVWEHTHYSRNKMFIDTMWESFSRFLTKKRIKPNTHLVDITKHLIFVAVGILPAFAPATNNQAAPIDGLLKVYLNDYGLETYVPTFMQPHHFSLEIPHDYVYYAMQIASYLESIPQFRLTTSTRTDLSELIVLMDTFIRELLHDQSTQGEVNNIYEKLKKIQFDYFHSDPDLDKGIYPSSDLPKEDARLLYMPPKYAKRSFCETSSFARGCIRISNKFHET